MEKKLHRTSLARKLPCSAPRRSRQAVPERAGRNLLALHHQRQRAQLRADLREAAKVARGNKVSRNVRALVVPGSQAVRAQAESEGLHEIFQEAGFEWRAADAKSVHSPWRRASQNRSGCQAAHPN